VLVYNFTPHYFYFNLLPLYLIEKTIPREQITTMFLVLSDTAHCY